MSSITLPSNVNELRAAIKSAIEFYQGSPVKNENKLNEALAAALDAGNYDRLHALMSQAPAQTASTYPISFDSHGEQFIIINGVRIDSGLAHDCVIPFTVRERDDVACSIKDYISLSHSRAQRELAFRDLDYLERSKETWVLESMETNKVIAADLEPDVFQHFCNEILAKAAEFYAKKIGPHQKTGTYYPSAVLRADETICRPVFRGELVLILERFAQEPLPVGMSVTRFFGDIPEGYMVACVDGDGKFYIPLNLRAQPDRKKNTAKI